ncbi:MAG TPA: DMT family transporter [Thermoleophilaceae bacterium]|jgi:drug/metabolite transporter (DMT)-like permease
MVAPPKPGPRSRTQLVGALMCAGSAASFGAMAIFGKLAYDAGVGVLTLLVVRFVLAGLLLGVANAVRRPRPRLPGRRALITALGLGAIGYAAQSGLFFTALTRIDAGLTALVLYVYPSLVTLGAVLLGRDRFDRVRVACLLIAFAGLVLILFVGDPAHVEALGVLLALGAALAYTGYILISDTVLSDQIDPLGLAALVCIGAAASFALAAAVSGEASLSFDAIGWLWLGAIGLVATVLAIVLFFGGLARVGPSRASMISTIEPLVTVALAFAVFGEALSATQLLGGALVLASVVLLQTLGRNPPATTAA